MNPQSHYIDALGRQLHVTVWGAQHLDTVVCWHGLARTGRDFDELARALAQRYRVLCPDTLGRGMSEWSPVPEQEYHLGFYAAQAAALLDAFGVQQVHWVGTSMGGAIALHGLCSGEQPLQGRIAKLVLNDIGPELAPAAVQRIKDYAGTPPRFQTMTALEQFFRQVYAPFGELTDAQWRRMAQTSWRRLPDGQITTHYDPAMVGQFTHHAQDYAQWAAWDALNIPVLCLHGELSDLILPSSASEMQRRGPGASDLLQWIEVEGVGHAPALNTDAQCAWVQTFLA